MTTQSDYDLIARMSFEQREDLRRFCKKPPAGADRTALQQTLLIIEKVEGDELVALENKRAADTATYETLSPTARAIQDLRAHRQARQERVVHETSSKFLLMQLAKAATILVVAIVGYVIAGVASGEPGPAFGFAILGAAGVWVLWRN